MFKIEFYGPGNLLYDVRTFPMFEDDWHQDVEDWLCNEPDGEVQITIMEEP